MAEIVLLAYIASAMVVMIQSRRHFRRSAARAVVATVVVIMIFAASWIYGAYKAQQALERPHSIDILAE